MIKQLWLLISWKRIYLFVCLFTLSLVAQEKKVSLYEENLYTVNFNNVSIVEFIKFVSKISKENFIFKQEELNFNVSVISSEPTSVESIISALLQTLRINGFSFIEESNNIIIHRTEDARGVPTVVSEENPLTQDPIPPVITQVFRLCEADAAVIAGIIKPMLSSKAIVGIEARSNQIIISDITRNVEQIGCLLLSLDIPSFTEFYMYPPKNRSGLTLLESIKETVESLQASDLADVAFLQTLKNAKYIELNNSLLFIGTAQAIVRVQTFLEMIDQQDVGKENLFLYSTQSDKKEKIENGLQAIASHLRPEDSLRETIDSRKWIASSHSFSFIGSANTITKLKEILAILDTEPEKKPEQKSYFIYKLKNVQGTVILDDFKRLAKNLENSGIDNTELIKTLKTAEWVKNTNSIYVSGGAEILDQVKNLLIEFDMGRALEGHMEQATSFFCL